MRVIGTVVRLQVQRSPLKPGERGARVYDPAPLHEVDGLHVGPRGVRGLTPGGDVPDVHHADHPQSRNVKLLNGISVMTRTQYDDLRRRYGPHLTDGIAGESVLLDAGGLDDLAGPLVLDTDEGPLSMTGVAIPPCIEFSRFVLGRGLGDTGPEVVAAMAALGNGARGFYLRGAGSGVVRRGASLRRA